MILIDERTHKSEAFKYEKGLEAFIEYINDGIRNISSGN